MQGAYLHEKKQAARLLRMLSFLLSIISPNWPSAVKCVGNRWVGDRWGVIGRLGNDWWVIGV